MVTNPLKPDVIIIDDTPLNINMLGEYLGRDYNVYIATSGIAGLELVRKISPDLILLDIIMPGIDGYEVCRRLKAEPVTRNIPIIFISAKASTEDESKGLELGAVDYIKKPFNLPVIKNRVHTHLSLKMARENAELLVGERTMELRKSQENLEKKTKILEETNTALQVLLRRRDQEKIEFENDIMINVNKLVRPYLEKLLPGIKNEKYKLILDAAIINLNEIVDPFARVNLAGIAQLTSAEIQVANFIKMGKSSREIASFLNISLRTVETHRGRIRKKTGLKKRTANLRNHLLSHL